MRRHGSIPAWLGAACMLALLLGAPPGHAQEVGVFDLSVEASSGVVVTEEVFDLTTAPPGADDRVFDLTSTSAGEEVFDLTAASPDGEEDVFDLTSNEVRSVPASSVASPSPSLPSTSQALVSPSSPSKDPAPVTALPERGKVVRVIDGDTYELEGGYRVRLAHVNTPEKRERIGPTVANAARKLLLHQEVTLSYGPVPRDHYGRLIADVRLEGRSVCEILLRQGLAHLFIIPPSRPENYEALVVAQREAREAQRGIWTEERYRGPLHITSFHANARGNDNENLAGEYLRVANTSGRPLNLAGFSLTNMRGMKLTFPDLVIPPGYSFQVFSGRGEPQGSIELPYKLFWNVEGSVWNNDLDQATLIDPDGRVIEEILHAPKRANPHVVM